MPDDDDRKRRRLGDATKSRIDELAEGWTVDPADVEPDDDNGPERPKAKTAPPPPPGSPSRPKPPSAPPPIPPRKPTQQVHALNAKTGPADLHSASASGVIEEPQRPSQGVIDPTKSIVIKSELELDDSHAAPLFDLAKIKAGPAKSGIPKLDLGASSSRPVFPLDAAPRGSPPPSKSAPARAAAPAPRKADRPEDRSLSGPPPARPPSPGGSLRQTIADDIQETIPEYEPSRLMVPADDSGVIVAPGDPQFVVQSDSRLSARPDDSVVLPSSTDRRSESRAAKSAPVAAKPSKPTPASKTAPKTAPASKTAPAPKTAPPVAAKSNLPAPKTAPPIGPKPAPIIEPVSVIDPVARARADDSGARVADVDVDLDDSDVLPLPPPTSSRTGARLPPGNSWLGPLGDSSTDADSDARLAVPVGEFDVNAETTIEEGKLKIAHQQATIVRDASNALLNIAESTSMRGDSTTVDGSTGRFERGDPTTTDASKNRLADVSSPRMTQSVGTIRTVAALRRKRGIAGDVRYVLTALMGVRNARREIADLEARQTTRQTSRRHHLTALGRAAVTNETHDHPALTRAREQLHAVEDDRARNAALVLAADLELDRVRRDRDAAAKKFLVDAGATDTELAELAKKLEPLEKEATGVRRRATALQESLKRIEKKIAETESRLNSPKGVIDRAAVQADIATLKADRVAVKRDEPVIADELDALAPRIAAIEAKRSDAERRRRELDKDELDDQRRSEELLAAIGAKRKVVERAAADAEVDRDKILFELGDRLYVDRPRNLKAQLAPVEEIDLEIGVGDRRIMELRELIGSVDKAKLLRGVAVIVLSAAAVIGLVTIILINVL